MNNIQDNNLVIESKIWDLHIHTNKCPKGTGEFSKLDNKQFIDKLLCLFEKYNNLEMISFTDHNAISYDVYEEYYSRDYRVKLIAGVEVDVLFEDDIQKHLIVYFDLKKENIKDFSIQLNNFMKKTPIKITDLLGFIISKKVKFALSPHAFKQGKRGIHYNWTTKDIVNQEASKYMDQFFIFWEASGYSEISRAIQFLKEMDSDNKISIISFSDSSDYRKLKDYLDNPTQYFLALPNFKGLQMVGTEISRIAKEKIEINSYNYGNLIGKVIFSNNVIKLSSGLNTIIGGRGSGKSIFLDSIAFKLNEKIQITDSRKEYISKFLINVYDYNNKEITSSFNFDYYEQSYISKLFSSKNYSEELLNYFKDAFNNIDDISIEEIKSKNKFIFLENLKIYSINSLENISAFSKKYSIHKDDNFNLNLLRKDMISETVIDYDDKQDFITKSLKLIPKKLQSNHNILNKIMELYKTLEYEIFQYNENIINNASFRNKFIDLYYEIRNKKNAILKEKNEAEDIFVKTFYEKARRFAERVNIINAIIKASIDFRTFYQHINCYDGVDKKAFMFAKELTVEHPLDYLIRKFSEYFNHTKTRIDFTIEYLYELINKYCYSFDDDFYISGKSSDELYLDLKKFELNYIYKNQIYYKIDDEYVNIETKSPGTQTNILMEYIVYKDTNRPLLIDQPEDNIDNQTVYKVLKNWFIQLKSKRQVIVVTHDANIVVNADSNNVIISSQEKKDEFKYTFGALEFNNNLELASNILDGGTEAVKRRLLKYGE